MSLVVEHFVKTGFGCRKGRTEYSPNSQKNYRTHILQFEVFLKARNKTASDGTVTDQDILDYVEHLKSQYRPNSVAVKIAAIKAYFTWLKKEGLTHSPIIKSQQHVKPTYKELSSADLNAIVKKMEGNTLSKQRDLAMFLLIVYCGFKTEEVVAINVEDIDFKNINISVKGQKRSFRSILAEIEGYAHAKKKNGIVCAKNEPFFLNRCHYRQSGRSLRRHIANYMKEFNSYDMRDLRQTYLTNMERILQMRPSKT